MKSKYKRNGLIYFLVIIVTITIYFVIHFYYSSFKKNVYQCNVEYLGGSIKHTVKNGDSLASIAKKYNITVEQLKKANNISSDQIFEGMELIIPKKDTIDPGKQPVNNIIAVDKEKESTEIESLSFAQSNISVKKGDSLKLTVEVIPVDLSSTKLTWKSSNPSVVSVDENGKIKGLKDGTATITVTAPNGISASITVTVVSEEIKAKSITLSPSELSLPVGSSSQISAKVEPENATNRELIWESSNPSVATVDDNGVVKGIAPGTTVVTVKTKDGTVVGQVVVTITAEVTPTPTSTPTSTSTPTATPTPTPKPISDDIIFTYEYDNGNYIYLINQFPIKDEVGKNLQGEKHTNDFKLKFNDKAVGVKYTITVEKLDGSDLDDEWAKQFLVNDGTDVANCYRNTNRVKTFNEYAMYNDNPNERILYEGVISSNEAARGYKDFTFRMWVSEDLQLNNSDYLSETRTFKTRINVYAVGK